MNEALKIYTDGVAAEILVQEAGPSMLLLQDTTRQEAMNRRAITEWN